MLNSHFLPILKHKVWLKNSFLWWEWPSPMLHIINNSMLGLNMRVRLDKLLAFRLSAISHRRNSHVLYPSLLCWAASWSPQSTEEGRLRRDTPFQHMLSLHPSHYQRSVQWCSGFTTPSSSSRLPATSAFKLCANSITSTAKCLENFPCNTKTHHKLARPENDSRMSIEESMHHDLCFIES